jgi:FixJ family two-component response regulator
MVKKLRPRTDINSSVILAVIDDDTAFRESLARLLKSEGYQVIQFASADAFLAENVREPLACVLVDLRMPGLSGIELQQQIKQMVPYVAVVFLTGHGGILESVCAMKAGAIDFLEKPVAEAELFAAIRRAVEQTRAAKVALHELASLQAKYKLLTPREREVFALVTAGLLNKQIAYKIGATERTVKAHRRQAMDKLNAQSLAHLVRIADQLGVQPISTEQREELSGRRFPSLNEAQLIQGPAPHSIATHPSARKNA